MKKQFLTDSQKDSLNKFPKNIIYEDMIKYFTLLDTELELLPKTSSNYNRLGYAIQLCALKYLGFFPISLDSLPSLVLNYVSEQLNVNPQLLKYYGKREQTKTNHSLLIASHLGFTKFNATVEKKLSSLLLEKALEHNKPGLLFEFACEKLLEDKVIRPGITTLEKLVSSVRQKSYDEIYKRLSQVLTNQSRGVIQNILQEDKSINKSRLSWLRYNPITNSPKSINMLMEKLHWLSEREINKWDLNNLNPNKIRYLAGLGLKSNLQVLKKV